MKVVFLGPSLPLAVARKLVKADFRPPARQGDVFRALADGAEAIALIDGVFEQSPSVWHHELIAAQASGVRVLGASSMGALRAAELPGVVEPVGEIARRFVSGEWNDDAHVALLHGAAEDGYRPLTLPWVNVWATVEAAVKRRVLTAREGREVCEAAERVFYQRRSWEQVVRALDWRDARKDVLRSLAKSHAVDLKAADAAAGLRALAKVPSTRVKAKATRFSSFVRRTRLSGGAGEPDDDLLRALLLAQFARSAGIEPDAERVAVWRARLKGQGDQREAWAEALALDELVLSAPERFVSDGPSAVEAAALRAAIARG